MNTAMMNVEGDRLASDVFHQKGQARPPSESPREAVDN